jgi:hypothetical protein
MHKVADIAMGVLVLAGIFTLVRPGSKGPLLVTNISSGFANVIKAATGGGSFATGK